MKKISTLILSVLAMSIVACSTEPTVVAPSTKGEPMTIGISTTAVDYEPLPASRADETADLLAVEVYEVVNGEDVAYAKGLFSEWSELSFQGFAGTTYKVEATMVVDAENQLYEIAGDYSKPFECAVTEAFEYSAAALTLSESTATLVDGKEYSVPTIDRYYGAASKQVTLADAQINTHLKRMTFGVKAAKSYSNISIAIEGAPVVELGTDIIFYSMSDIESAWAADESEDAYSESLEVVIYRDGVALPAQTIEVFRNQLAVLTISKDDFTLGFDFEEGFPTEDIRTLTFEDADYKGGSANYWSSLIDSKQYGGLLLYGEDGSGSDIPYEWVDTDNTQLSSGLLNAWDSYALWNGGHVISNYVETTLENGTDQTQLSVYYADEVTGFGGNNGSENFAIHYGYIDDKSFGTELPTLSFADGEEHTINHMFIAPTTYFANAVINGSSFSSAAGAEDFAKIVMTGYGVDGTERGVVEFFLLENGECIEGWNKCDLSTMGAVSYVTVNIAGSIVGEYGLNIPAYFAYDDVEVSF